MLSFSELKQQGLSNDQITQIIIGQADSRKAEADADPRKALAEAFIQSFNFSYDKLRLSIALTGFSNKTISNAFPIKTPVEL